MLGGPQVKSVAQAGGNFRWKSPQRRTTELLNSQAIPWNYELTLSQSEAPDALQCRSLDGKEPKITQVRMQRETRAAMRYEILRDTGSQYNASRIICRDRDKFRKPPKTAEQPCA